MSKGLGDTKPNVHRGYMIHAWVGQLALSWSDDITWGIPPPWMRLIWQNHIFQAMSGFIWFPNSQPTRLPKEPLWKTSSQVIFTSSLIHDTTSTDPRFPSQCCRSTKASWWRDLDEKVKILMWLIENFWRTDPETKQVTRNIALNARMHLIECTWCNADWHWHWNNSHVKTAETWNLLTSTVLPYLTFPTCIDFWILQNEAFWWCRWKASYRSVSQLSRTNRSNKKHSDWHQSFFSMGSIAFNVCLSKHQLKNHEQSIETKTTCRQLQFHTIFSEIEQLEVSETIIPRQPIGGVTL